MLAEVIDVLADPNDGTPLHGDNDFRRLVSESGHSFDVAKQGYVSLLAGAGRKHDGDSAGMIQARETFLAGGHFAPFVEAVTEAMVVATETSLESSQDSAPVIIESGAGTGYYLSHSLDSISGARGVGLDISTPAAKQLAKCHPRVGAVVADVWRRLPLANDCADALSVVFAPRNMPEFARVLKPAGQVVVLTPDTGHLDELRKPLGIVSVEEDKIARLYQQAHGILEPIGSPRTIEFAMRLEKASIAAQVKMSPSARHISAEELEHRLAGLPESMTVTARGRIDCFTKPTAPNYATSR